MMSDNQTADFLSLLYRCLKANPACFAAVSDGWKKPSDKLLIGYYDDVYYYIIPSVSSIGVPPSLLTLGIMHRDHAAETGSLALPALPPPASTKSHPLFPKPLLTPMPPWAPTSPGPLPGSSPLLTPTASCTQPGRWAISLEHGSDQASSRPKD